jgi:hypothetical protein
MTAGRRQGEGARENASRDARRGIFAFGSPDRRAFMCPARLITRRNRGEGRPYRVSLDLKSIRVSAWLRIFVSSRRHRYNARALQLIDRVPLRQRRFLSPLVEAPAFHQEGAGARQANVRSFARVDYVGSGVLMVGRIKLSWPATTHEVQV